MTQHILCVDDEAPMRETLRIFFKKVGFGVTTATTSAEAKESLNKTAFNLAILDIDLAGENGLELLAFVKEKYPSLPVILFTGLVCDENLVKSGLDAGAECVIQKTDSLDEILRAVRRTLDPAAQKT